MLLFDGLSLVLSSAHVREYWCCGPCTKKALSRRRWAQSGKVKNLMAVAHSVRLPWSYVCICLTGSKMAEVPMWTNHTCSVEWVPKCTKTANVQKRDTSYRCYSQHGILNRVCLKAEKMKIEKPKYVVPCDDVEGAEQVKSRTAGLRLTDQIERFTALGQVQILQLGAKKTKRIEI